MKKKSKDIIDKQSEENRKQEIEKKINKYSKDAKKKIIEEYIKDKEELNIHFLIDQKPEPYARARAGRYGFYNPKAQIEKDFREICSNQLSIDQKNILWNLMKNEDSIYYVYINGDFYVPISKSDSGKMAILKEEKIILPAVRNGDIDNYMKLILDALHTVIYTDDKRVINISANKYYSNHPRSEIDIKIIIIKK